VSAAQLKVTTSTAKSSETPLTSNRSATIFWKNRPCAPARFDHIEPVVHRSQHHVKRLYVQPRASAFSNRIRFAYPGEWQAHRKSNQRRDDHCAAYVVNVIRDRRAVK